MSDPYRGFADGERRDDASSRRGAAVPPGAAPEGGAPAGRRALRALSKGALRTFQTVLQHNGRAQRMLPPPRREGPPIRAATDGTYGLGLPDAPAGTPDDDDDERDRPASPVPRGWGRALSADLGGCAARRAAPWLRRPHARPAAGVEGRVPGLQGTEVSFDYQLMKDGEGGA